MEIKSSKNNMYTKFTKHENNINEIINATHINDVQTAITKTEKNVITAHCIEFMNSVMFKFDNNMQVNSLFTNTNNEKKYLDLILSKDITYNEEETSTIISSNATSGDMYTTKIQSSVNPNSFINDFSLIMNIYLPIGSTVKCYIITNKNEIFPIRANSPIANHIFSDITDIKIKIVMSKNLMNESPKIYGLAMMYFDKSIEDQYNFASIKIPAGVTTHTLIQPEKPEFHNAGDIWIQTQ